MNPKKLREKKARLIAEAKAIEAGAAAEDRATTPEELETIEAKLNEAEGLEAQAVELEHRADVTARLSALDEDLERSSRPRSIEGLEDVRTRATVTGPAFASDPFRGFGASMPNVPTLRAQDPEAYDRKVAQGFGEFAALVHAGITPTGAIVSRDERLAFMAAASGLSQGVPSEAGILVPPAFSQNVYDRMQRDPNNLMPMCDVIQIPEGIESLTIPAIDETSRATGSRWGGLRAYWLAEAEQMTGSKPKLRGVRLEPHQLGVFVYSTDKLLKNAPAVLGALLERGSASEIAFLVNDAIVEGDGAGKPLGYKNSGALVVVAKEGGQAADTIVAANVNKMWARVHVKSRQNAVWLNNQDTEPQLESMSGADSSPIYLPPGGLADAPYGRLKGRPVLAIEFAETLGDQGDLTVADLKAYALALRGGVESAMSMHLRFDYNETAFRFLFEADGRPWIDEAITPFKGTAKTSPFVTLAERA